MLKLSNLLGTHSLPAIYTVHGVQGQAHLWNTPKSYRRADYVKNYNFTTYGSDPLASISYSGFGEYNLKEWSKIPEGVYSSTTARIVNVSDNYCVLKSLL